MSFSAKGLREANCQEGLLSENKTFHSECAALEII
jgi:hypothetical protein